MTKEDVISAILEMRKFNSETYLIEAKTAKGGFPSKCYDTFSSFSNKGGRVIENRHSEKLTMKDKMKKVGLKEPEFIEGKGLFTVIFRYDGKRVTIDFTSKVISEVTGEVSGEVEKYKNKILEFCNTPKSSIEIMNYLDLNSRNYVRNEIIKPLLELKILEPTNKIN